MEEELRLARPDLKSVPVQRITEVQRGESDSDEADSGKDEADRRVSRLLGDLRAPPPGSSRPERPEEAGAHQKQFGDESPPGQDETQRKQQRRQQSHPHE